MWDQDEPALAPVWEEMALEIERHVSPVRSRQNSKQSSKGHPFVYEEVEQGPLLEVGVATPLSSVASFASYQYEQAKDDVPPWQQICRDFVTRCEPLMALLIIANAIVIGFETDMTEMQNVWDVAEAVFLAVFATELLLKVLAFGLDEFFSVNGMDFYWNLFDFLIVFLGLFDFLVSRIVGGSGTGGIATVFRIVRLLRILRIFRIVKFFSQLYVLAFGMALASVAMFWVTFLMVFVLYICSIILVRTCGHAPDSDPHQLFLRHRFGTILKSMLTLFELMCAPNLHEYHHVMGERPAMMVFLICFVIFGYFGLVALMTGVISETMFEKNVLRMEQERTAREASRRTLIRHCRELFDNVNVNEANEAHRDDIKGLLPELFKVFDKLNVAFNQDDLESMTECLTPDELGFVKKEEFRRCIVQMAEGLAPLQIMELYHKVGVLEVRTEKCETVLEDVVDANEILVAKRSEYPNSVGKALDKLASRCEDIAAGLQRLIKRVDELEVECERVMELRRSRAAALAAAEQAMQANAAEGSGPSAGYFQGLGRKLSPLKVTGSMETLAGDHPQHGGSSKSPAGSTASGVSLE